MRFINTPKRRASAGVSDSLPDDVSLPGASSAADPFQTPATSARSVASRWQHQENLWRAVWPIVEGLCGDDIHTLALVGQSSFAALSVVPARVRDRARIEAPGDPSVMSLAAATYPGFHWSRADADAVLPAAYADVVIAEIDADERVSARSQSFVSRLRLDEERVIDSLAGLRGGGVLVGVIHGGLFERPASAARERMHELADAVALAKVPLAWVRERCGLGPLDIVVFRKRLPRERVPPQARFLSLTNFEMRSQQGSRLRMRINSWYQGDSTTVRNGTFGHMHLVPVAESRALAMHGSDSATVLGPYFSQCLSDYLARRQSRPPFQSHPTVRLPTIRIEPPHGMADFFTQTHDVSLTCDLDGRPIALLPGRLLVHAGLIYEVQSVAAERVRVEPLPRLSARNGDALLRIIQIRDAMYETLRAQVVSEADPIQQEKSRQRLNDLYDDFRRRHGPLNAEENRRLYASDPDHGRIASLEIYTEESGVADKAEIFFGNVLSSLEGDTRASTLAEALAMSLNALGRLDPTDIAARLGKEVEDIQHQIIQSGWGYFDPTMREWQTAAHYLSGDIVSKLADARAWASREECFEHNVEALASVRARAIPAEDITVRLGAAWIPEEVIETFLDEVYGMSGVATVSYGALSGTWTVKFSAAMSADARNTTEFGTPRRPFQKLLEAGLNQRSIDVYDKIGESSKLNVEQTLLAQEKLARLEHSFTQFLWKDPERRERLAQLYNDAYNRFRSPRYDGSHLRFPGMSLQIRMQAHQKNDVWRFLTEGNLLLARAVGRGKTFTQVACAMESKRLGRCQKPAWSVPDELLGKSEREARRLYPGARIFSVAHVQIAAGNLERTVETICGQDWDLVIYGHGAFTELRLAERCTELAELYQEDRALQEGERLSRGYLRGGFKRRLGEVRKRVLELRSEETLQTDSWLRLGHDTLIVDEAHRFKNLGTAPDSLQAGSTASRRASDLLDKISRHYEMVGQDRGVVLSSATPLSNSLLELFTLQRFLTPTRLASMGMHTFRLWSTLFLKPIIRYEPDLTGEGFRSRTRYILQNAPEALGLLRSVLAISDGDEHEVVVPEMQTTNIAAEMSPAQTAALGKLRERLAAIRARSVDYEQDHLLRIVTDSRKLGLDARLLDPTAEDWQSTKVCLLADKLVEINEQWADERGVQLVFCDLGVPNGRLFDLYADIRRKLVERGIPAAEIAFVHDYVGVDKDRFFNAVRTSVFRIGIGSTEQMGEGGDMQSATVAVHHLDGPWRASDIEQRDGRARRPGNELLLKSGKPLLRFIYTTKDSFDRYMWETMRYKAEVFSRLLRGDSSIRSFDADLDPSYATTVAITSGNPMLRAQVELQDRLARLNQLSRAHAHQVGNIRAQINNLQAKVHTAQRRIEQTHRLPSGDGSERWVYRGRVDNVPPSEDFEGGSHRVFQRIAQIQREYNLTEIRGLHYSAVPVLVSVGWDGVASRPRLDWFLRVDGHENRYWGPSAIADAISVRDGLIQDLQKTLADKQRELYLWQSQADRAFPHERDLQLCARALKVVEEMIRVDSKTLPTDIDVEVRRELHRCLLGRDGDTLEIAGTKEIKDEQPQRQFESPKRRRKQSL